MSYETTITDNLQCMTTPYFNFFKRDINLSVASIDRNVVLFTAHVVFFMFNVLNVAYVVLIEGYVKRLLRKNFQLQLATCAAAIQLFSCYSSIKRYNINDQHGFWGKFSVGAGFVAFSVFGAASLRIIMVCLKNDVYGRKDFK